MLVLTRRRGEKIRIGPDIEITLVDVRGDHSVRIGIDAPKDVIVMRTEIAEKLVEKAAAANAASARQENK